MSQYRNVLNTERKEIRRLILQPVSAGQDIQCSTETISLLYQPEYEALSYAWGRASVRQNIIFNGTPFSVTENLAVALSHLRLPDQPRNLWIDALCINQENVEERNDQVLLMGEIYANAKPVLIWLGPKSEDSGEAFALMSNVTSEAELMEEVSQSLFSFYLRLIDREWFTRLWTVQEMVLANNEPLVGCGPAWTTWSILSQAWKKVALNEFGKMGMITKNEATQNEENRADDFTSGVRLSGIKIDLLNNLRSSVGSKGGENLRNLILNTNSLNATEPRDRIYALLGMMSREHRSALNVDYNQPLAMVYAEAVAFIFNTGNGPWLLSGMELAGSLKRSSFPSWVPLFGNKTLLSPTRFHGPGIGVSGSGSDCVNGTVDPDLETLRVRGMPIDTIMERVLFDDQDQCLHQLSQVDALARKAHELAALHSNSRPYLNAFKIKEPVWRALIANKKYSGATLEVAPDTYGEMYQILLHGQDPTCMNNNDDSEFYRDYKLSLLNSLPSRCFFITDTGFFGIGPSGVEKGDQLAIWFGSPAPFVLRLTALDIGDAKEPIFNVLGSAYVSGIMDGEMVDEVYCEDLEDDVVFVVQ